MQELLVSLAARVGVTVTDVQDEHDRWQVYAQAVNSDDCADLLLEAVGLEPDLNVALSVVLRKLEVVPQADRQRWVDGLTGDIQRQFAARRAAELPVLETRPLAPSLQKGIEQEWSDWLQLRLAESSPERDVISRLSRTGRTKRIRRTAAERLKRR
ncbi:hypothetical protein AB0C29_06735 [Actinoplanes sp. NPDC048791]|uniref:hypothetical protein n=1 Tax=Actinoplanes sp. NPDC048791 TaxID=3154623 RepID=UPI0033D87ECF